MLVFGARDDCGALDVLATESKFQWLDTEKKTEDGIFFLPGSIFDFYLCNSILNEGVTL